MNIKFSPPDIGSDEINAVIDTLKSGWITTGPKTKEFEQRISEYCSTKKTVCLNSATAGLELILRLWDVGDGDEVITSAYTYTASASVIKHVGAKIVLCDTQKDSVEMDYEKLGSLITKKTKAIIGVDIAGVIANYDKIFDIVLQKKNLFTPKNDFQKKLNRVLVVADAAHSFGAIQKGILSGNVADFTSFSFHAVKNLTTAEGGAVTWKSIDDSTDGWIYKQFMLLSLHGQNKDALEKSKSSAWEYDIVNLGYKYNMTDIMAAIGIAQLGRYKNMLTRRREIYEYYKNELENDNIQFIKHNGKEFESSYHLCIASIKHFDEIKRNNFISLLASKGIPLNVHYKPLPMFTAYRNAGFNIKNFPNAFAMYEKSFTLPLHTLLTNDEIEYVAREIKKNVG